MPHSYVHCHVHLIFSTKDRRPLIAPEWKSRLWAYIGGVARENNVLPMCIGGTENHAHVLLALPSTVTIAKTVQVIKAGSSKWMNEIAGPFEWQGGYGAFSVSASMIDATRRYIEIQETHHRQKTFEDEYLEILKKCGIEYDPRYVFD